MLNPKRDAQLRHLGADTGGAIDLYRCREAGLTDQRIAWLVESGRWQSPYPRTYVTFSGPPPPTTIMYAAVMYAGAGATLSHESAGALWQLCRVPALIHLTVPFHREVEDQPGIILHRSRTLTPAYVHQVFRPARTTIERTVMDLLATSASADSALALVSRAVRTRLTTADRLRDTILGLPKTRWRKVVLDALPDVSAGAQSVLELRDAQIRRSHGLPQGERQVKRLGDGTEILDVLIAEYGVHIELDGRLGHDSALDQWRDMRRDNRSEMAGLRHLRYGWADIVERPCEVAAQQAEILRQQGWPGRLKPCPTCPTAFVQDAR